MFCNFFIIGIFISLWLSIILSSVPDPALRRLDKIVRTWRIKGYNRDYNEENVIEYIQMASSVFFLKQTFKVSSWV